MDTKAQGGNFHDFDTLLDSMEHVWRLRQGKDFRFLKLETKDEKKAKSLAALDAIFGA